MEKATERKKSVVRLLNVLLILSMNACVFELLLLNYCKFLCKCYMFIVLSFETQIKSKDVIPLHESVLIEMASTPYN